MPWRGLGHKGRRKPGVPRKMQYKSKSQESLQEKGKSMSSVRFENQEVEIYISSVECLKGMRGGWGRVHLEVDLSGIEAGS
eukprot:jgi/Botrbrau1/11921/Bobra.0259s0010.1